MQKISDVVEVCRYRINNKKVLCKIKDPAYLWHLI